MEAVKFTPAEFHGIPAERVDAIWPEVSRYLQQALDRTGTSADYGVEDIYKGLKARDYQCWIVVESGDIISAGITQIVIYPKRKILTIPLVGSRKGTLQSWLPYLETLKDYGRAYGCSAIRGWGREGWKKVLPVDSLKIEFELEILNENLH